MSTVYITICAIVPGKPSREVLETLEFEADTWMDALDAAYNWLKQNQKETCSYHVYC
jgi:hypothetical protein